MNYKHKSKLPQSEVSVFARMTALALEYNAINLAQGFPDFNPPAALIDFLFESAKEGLNQYAPMPGLLPLREQISERLLNDYSYHASVDKEITVTAGATQAIYTIISTFIGPGDKVLLFEPAYDSYAPAIIANGGIPVYLRLQEPEFNIPWDKFENLIHEHQFKIILFNNPHNPCGSILSLNDLKKIDELTQNLNTLLLWDEVYDLLVFDHIKHISALKFSSLMERSIVVFSMGKTLHNTGWKIGYIVAREYLSKEIRKLHQFTVFSVHTPSQMAIARFMKNEPQFFSELSGFYQRKRDLFRSLLMDSSFKVFHTSGSYFALADYSKVKNCPDEKMAFILAKDYKVAAIPISAFYHDHYDPHLIRFCFAKQEETILEAAKRLKSNSITISKE